MCDALHKTQLLGDIVNDFIRDVKQKMTFLFVFYRHLFYVAYIWRSDRNQDSILSAKNVNVLDGITNRLLDLFLLFACFFAVLGRVAING